MIRQGLVYAELVAHACYLRPFLFNQLALFADAGSRISLQPVSSPAYADLLAPDMLTSRAPIRRLGGAFADAFLHADLVAEAAIANRTVSRACQTGYADLLAHPRRLGSGGGIFYADLLALLRRPTGAFAQTWWRPLYRYRTSRTSQNISFSKNHQNLRKDDL